MSVAVRAPELGLLACRVCGLLSPPAALARATRCRRCASLLHAGPVLHSAQLTLACLIAGVTLYLPANLLPVMHVSGIGGGQDSTILSGVLSFWRAGSWDIAVLIFAASVAVPMTKFIALGLLLWTVRRRSAWAMRERAKLYRLLEIIGYWSMLDVVVVALTSALLQFKTLGTAEPRLGIVFFCAVVVLTMLAAMSFDPRLIWEMKRGDVR